MGETSEKIAVPKFSSFKPKTPKPTPTAATNTDDRSATSTEKEKRDITQSKEHHRHRSRGAERGLNVHRKRRPRSRGPESAPRPHRKVKVETKPPLVSSADISTSSSFTIDTQGDPLIREYGLDRRSIPQHSRHGGGRVLGSSGRLSVHVDGPREEFSLPTAGGASREARYTHGLWSRSWQGRKPYRLRSKKEDRLDEYDEDFISWESSRKRKRKRSTPLQKEDEEEDLLSWRIIKDKAKKAAAAADKEEQKICSSSDEIDDGEDNESKDPLQLKSAHLNKRTKENPTDIEAWLELAEHQDDLFRASDIVDNKALGDAAHSFTEVKVHILETALKHTTRKEDRQRVLIALVREGVKTWSSKTSAKYWTQFAQEERDCFRLWKAHLDFVMTNLSTFRYDDVKEMLLGRLRQVVARSNLREAEDIEEAIYVLLRATRFFHDAGFAELAVASWQGLMEYNYFRPKHYPSEEEALSGFREFWESEVPRIGEPDAKGWASFVASGICGKAPEPATAAATHVKGSADRWQAWAELETSRSTCLKMPSRTLDEGTDEDPFRVVMASDIEPWLFVIPSSALSKMSRPLLDAFLLFCGLPPAFRSSRWIEEANVDQFVSEQHALDPTQLVLKDDEGGDGEHESKITPSSSDRCRGRLSPDLLFGGDSWFSLLASAKHEIVVEAGFEERSLQQILDSAFMPDLALYYLGIRFARDPLKVKQAARSLLKKDSNSALLYDAYIRAEATNGNLEAAERILVTVTAQSHFSSASTGYVLFKTWSMLALESGDKTRATLRLCAAVDASLRASTVGADEASPKSVLKARHEFDGQIYACLGERRIEDAGKHMECLVLLSYLTSTGATESRSASQGNIAAAMAVVADMSMTLQSRGYGEEACYELLLQFACRLLFLHAQKGPFRRLYFRQTIARFVAVFPRNTLFLSMFDWATDSVRVKDDTRTLLEEVVFVKPHDCLSCRLFAVQHEASRGSPFRTQAAFEHALSSDVCKWSPALWISYIRFCASQRQLAGMAKKLFFRALTHCPWAKRILMEAFRNAGLGLDEGELKSVYGMMQSKGLRVHVDLDGS